MSQFILPSRATDANNNPLSGALLYFYLSGTSTPADTYSDDSMTTAHANPVVADSGGLFPPIYTDQGVSYRAVLKTALGVQIDEFDPYSVADLTGTRSEVSASSLTGLAIREDYNPGNLASWTGTASFSYEGVSVDVGNYGPRQFGTAGTPTALNGSINIPASATIVNHASGVSGYVKSGSTTTGGVALYGEANRTAANALIWGFNTRTQDGGFGGLNVWGYEMDMNIDNVTTTAIGFDAVGGSTVEPTNSIAYLCQPIGVFAIPKKRWKYGFRSTDAATQIGIELGAQGDTASSASQIFQMNYRNAANTSTTGLVVQISGAGDTSIIGGPPTKLFVIKTVGSSVNNINMIDNGIGFYGATPANKQTVTGARGGNTALASALTALANLGLLTDSTTA